MLGFQSFLGRLFIFMVLFGIFLLLGMGCAGRVTPPVTGDEPVFPPHQLRPVKLAIAGPVQSMDLGAAHASLAKFSDSPAQRRTLMACAWRTGVPELVQLAVPGSEINSYLLGRSPFLPSKIWVDCVTDTLGNSMFTLTATAAMDIARQREISHLVVPRFLNYAPAGKDSSATSLNGEIIIIDITEREIVWQGDVFFSSEKMGSKFRADGEQPQLTSFEIATYGWVLELCSRFDRVEVEAEAGLGALGLECHDPLPVLGE